MYLKTVVRFRSRFWWLLGLLLCAINLKASVPLDKITVQSWATWSESPAEIVLHWVRDTNAVSYAIYRKSPEAQSWTQVANSIPGTETAWTDRDVQIGTAYEYQFQKRTDIPQTGYGYVYAGIRLPLVESRGKVILLVEKSLATPLAVGLNRFELDLIGDGWTVIRHDIDATAPVPEVKQIIQADYLADPENTKSLILFGHIPVPYSGYIAPDGHNDHRGAWPADVYYGEFDGEWTDTTVTTTNFVAHPNNKNIPGDGKFDQGRPPGPIRLQIGRVDLSRLTCFANKTPSRDEVALARQYLDKDHAFRHGQLNVPRRALIYSRVIGSEDEPQTATAYRNFRSFFSEDPHVIGMNEFLPTLNANAYLWSYIVSAGDITQCHDVASSDHLALNDPKTIFTSFLGSYFGDWDRESAFLRSTLGTSTHILTTFYGGHPQWILHPMSLGGTIGESARLTQNNGTNGLYEPHVNYGVGEVHISLLGDPTLRLHPVLPPKNLTGTASDNGFEITWDPSLDTSLVGYHVYRSTSASGPFQRLNTQIINDRTFLDPSGTTNHHYMVRSVKLETTPAGSYLNASQGIFFPNGEDAQTPPVISDLSLAQISTGGPLLAWAVQSGSADSFQIERRLTGAANFEIVGSAGPIDRTYLDATAAPALYTYRVNAITASGAAVVSNELVVDLRTPSNSIVGIDEHSGDWRGIYGEEGYVIYEAATNLPPYVSIDLNYSSGFVFDRETDEEAALIRPDGSSRLYAFRYVPLGPLDFQFRFTDSRAHRVAIYVVDPQDRRIGEAELVDPYTGQLVARLPFGEHSEGKYLLFDIQRYGNIRIKPATNSTGNAVISGIFFMPAILEPPVISPPEGGFPGKTVVSMNSHLGGTIRFTTDGTDPTETSPIYTGPFANTQSLNLKARVFKDGYDPSEITAVSLTNSLISSAGFLSMDNTTQGDWQKTFTQEAFSISNGASKISDTFELTLANTSEYMWSDSTSDLRALHRAPDNATRIASCWFSETEFQLNATFWVERPQILALYFLDWDGAGRVQEIVVTDPAGVELDRQRLEDFTDGKYLVWNVQGPVRFTIKKIAGPNAILNGMFVGAVKEPIPSPVPARLDSVLLSNGAQNQIRLYGQPGQTIDIESSPDLKTWTLFRRTTFSGTVMDWTFSVPSEPGMRFYRANVIP